MLIVNQRHLEQVLAEYVDQFNGMHIDNLLAKANPHSRATRPLRTQRSSAKP